MGDAWQRPSVAEESTPDPVTIIAYDLVGLIALGLLGCSLLLLWWTWNAREPLGVGQFIPALILAADTLAAIWAFSRGAASRLWYPIWGCLGTALALACAPFLQAGSAFLIWQVLLSGLLLANGAALFLPAGLRRVLQGPQASTHADLCVAALVTLLVPTNAMLALADWGIVCGWCYAG